MARNGTGTYTVPNSFTPTTTIDSSDMNDNFSDMGDELTNSVAVDGQSVMTGALKAANGSAGTPSITFGSDLNTGFYRDAADTPAISAGGTKVASFPSTGPVFDPGIPTASIADDAVTYAKIQNVSATDKILGRSTSGAGNIEEIACTSAGRAILDDADADAQLTTLGAKALAKKDTIDSASLIDTAVKQAINPFGLQLLHVREIQTSGTTGSTAAGSATWATCVINSTPTNEITSASVSSNVISLPAGTYFIDANVTFGRNGNNIVAKLRLRNTSDSTTAILGLNSSVNSTNDILSLRGRFTIAGTKNHELQIYGSSGGGSAPQALSSGESEVYLDAMIWKIA